MNPGPWPARPFPPQRVGVFILPPKRTVNRRGPASTLKTPVGVPPYLPHYFQAGGLPENRHYKLVELLQNPMGLLACLNQFQTLRWRQQKMQNSMCAGKEQELSQLQLMVKRLHEIFPLLLSCLVDMEVHVNERYNRELWPVYHR